MVDFIDAESPYSLGKKTILSYRDVLMLHFQKILNSAGVEFRGGYYEERVSVMPGNLGKTGQVYVPDTRQVFCNLIDVFADAMCPHFDDEMIKEESMSDKELLELHDETKKKFQEDTEDYKQYFLQRKVFVKRRLFRALCKFYKRKNYFEAEIMEEGT